MITRFQLIKVSNFKNHAEVKTSFGPITRISGRNGIGKSGMGEAVTWLLFNVDMMGSKYEPAPLTANEKTVTSVELLMSVEREGQGSIQILLGKQLVNGKNKYFVNEVPEKATMFDEIVNELFDKNLFLSCFNPIYFFSQHWKEQREQLLKYVNEPLEAEILAAMPSKQKAAALELAIKKRSVADVEKIYKPKYAEADKKHERAAERTITLKEQLEQAQAAIEHIDEAAIDEEKNTLEEQAGQAQAINADIQNEQRKRSQLEYEISDFKKQINRIKENGLALQAQEIAEACRTCGQDLDEAAVNKTKENKIKELDDLREKGRALIKEYKEKEAAFKALPQLGAAIETGQALARIYELKSLLETKERLKPLEAQVKEAAAAQEAIKQERIEALELLEAIKEYNTAKSELMVDKVGGLFKNLSVILETEAKNGNISPAFEVEYAGKPFSKLSTAERIKAGLELINVLSAESNNIMPVFIDNAESIITFTKPLGQLITATVKNSDLIIKVEGDLSE